MPKMVKYADDPCFGKKYKEISDCEACWIKNACNIAFRNRK